MKKFIVMAALAVMAMGSAQAQEYAEGHCDRTNHPECGKKSKPPMDSEAVLMEQMEVEMQKQAEETTQFAAEGPCERKYDSCGIVKKPPMVQEAVLIEQMEAKMQVQSSIQLAEIETHCDRSPDPNCEAPKPRPKKPGFDEMMMQFEEEMEMQEQSNTQMA